MHLEKIILTQFKNYEAQTLTFSPKINCFVGRNGMGKTNLLDAIFYLCLCKSYFLASDSDVILRGSDFLRLEGYFLKNNRREKIVAKVQPRKKKVFERNDSLYNALSDHIGFLPIVMFAPDDTLLAKEGSEERRRFMDAVLSQIDNQYLTHLIFYNKNLEQRNALLKSLSQNTTDMTNFETLLSVYDRQLVPSAQYIFEKRKTFTQQLTPIFDSFYKKIADAQESVSVAYESPLSEASLGEILKKNREKDRILQRTTSGIHRDDLDFLMNEKSLKKFGSQGQLKSFILSLKLAQYKILSQSLHASDSEMQENPILLLDDIFDKLDETRVQNFIQLIVNESLGQIFITDTHEERITEIAQSIGIETKIFVVENGEVTAEKMLNFNG